MGFAPAESSSEVNVCRQSCIVCSVVIPAAARAVLKRLDNSVLLMGLPFSMNNLLPLSATPVGYQITDC